MSLIVAQKNPDVHIDRFAVIVEESISPVPNLTGGQDYPTGTAGMEDAEE